MLLGLQRGKVDEVSRMLSACMLCGKCTMVCPRGIKTRRLILTVSKLYKKEEGK
jgi:heterodisulfide reductase subunit C